MNCCTIKPMPNSNRGIETLFNKDKLDEFESDGDLGKCKNFEISHLSIFGVRNYVAKVS